MQTYDHKTGNIELVYRRLLDCYGPQGWWPLLSCAGKPGFDERGYHKADYSHPDSENERFEVAIGAILTQNTSWKNVEGALSAMHKERLFSPSEIAHYPIEKLKLLVRPCGYFNQKTKKVLIIASFFESLHSTAGSVPERAELLALWGVGKETADSILLYAWDYPAFVVDAYTKRIFSRLGLIAQTSTYDEIQARFESNIPKDPKLYNEYHALIVVHAKAHCAKNPDCEACPLADMCETQ
jgi:endonuclease III related protein